ncbi:hypothetical protein LTR36_006160 [Oleoguttula mirabilis]|uniref:Uncharacterized protein n=1 Tax=Oleoguttula mirabilis TaxID=1507867 RepID=A0AAV9JD79_9PEZI|nr:hypothetical protein LTR36_006160 [Oleoguttula mirabilis]
MPPTAPKKGSNSKAGTRDRRSSSRHSTPVSALTESTAPPTPLTATATPTPAPPSSNAVPKETAYLRTFTAAIMSADASIETLIAATSSKHTHEPPTAKELHGLHDVIKDTVNRFMGKRGEVCDRSMRQLVQRRKERVQVEREAEVERQAREQAAAVAKREVERERVKRENEKEKERTVSRKRSREEMEVEGDGEESEGRKQRRESLPSVGAHGLARQDGVGVHEGAPPPLSPPVEPGTAAIDPMDTAPSPADSDDARAAPTSTIPLYERAFGKDPTTFDDPTVYDIRPLTPDMTDDDKRDIFNVSHWPDSDLHDLTAGDPPDADFSNAKPPTQVNFTTFQGYVEPYIRAFTEEDVAFLKERGDRVTPYIIPQRGPKGHKDIWAAEDGLTGIEPPAKLESNPNEARGSMEDMDDNAAETDEISMGPVMNRLLSLTRPAPNGAVKKQEDEQPPETNGDIPMSNGDDNTLEPTQPGAEDQQQQHNKPATYLPADAPRPTSLSQLDYESLEQRAIQELRHIGFLPAGSTTDTNAPTSMASTATPAEDFSAHFEAHNDDEVAARLRTLQHELRRVSRLNNVRKARVLELTEERMAMQEYANIADDLDNQVNAAYLKRNRSLAKPTKKSAAAANSNSNGNGTASRAGGRGVATNASAGGRGVSDGVRALMQKRRDWVEMVGPVVGFGRPGIVGEGETVFEEGGGVMRRLERGEREREAEVEMEMGEGEGE